MLRGLQKYLQNRSRKGSGEGSEVALVYRKTSNYHQTSLFTIQKLSLHRAKATKISIFWHPKTTRKQLSSQAGAKMPRYQPTWCQDNPAGAKIAAAAGAKMPRYQPSWCQDIKIPSRARPSRAVISDSQLWGDSKNRPFWYQNSNMSICHENILFTTL